MPHQKALGDRLAKILQSHPLLLSVEAIHLPRKVGLAAFVLHHSCWLRRIQELMQAGLLELGPIECRNDIIKINIVPARNIRNTYRRTFQVYY